MRKREIIEMTREIERFPACPALTPNEIATITSTVFVQSNPKKADVLFIFGSSYGNWEQVANLYRGGFVPMVFVAGGLKYGEDFETIMSHTIREALVHFGVPQEAIIVDDRSRNTLEDALFGRDIFVEKHIPHQRILFAAKAPHSGRCLKTLRKIFPESELFPFIYDFMYGDRLITEKVSEAWWKEPFGRSYVYGEYQRILLYSSRGDI